jgi:hypothetical protein
MLLFDDTERSYEGFALHNESTYDYYQRSARKDISTIRNTLNEWFQSYPDNEKKELKNSFVEHFDNCFFELFLFHLFEKLDFQVKVHPKLTNSSRRPDFLIKRNNLEIYIEAKVVKDKTKEEEALERKINQFYDDFSKIKLKGFLLSIDEFIIKTKKQPSTRHAVNYIESEVSKIDPDVLIQECESFGFERIPIIEYENDDLHIIVRPMPTIPTARDKKNIRPIGIYPGDSFWGGGEESLRDSICSKAKRYGQLDKPFIVCIDSLDIKTQGLIDVENAIWGSQAISWSEDPNNRDEKWIRKLDGVFLDSKGPKLKNLSGVFVTRVFPHNIPNAEYWLFKNPFSTNEFDFNNLGLVYSYVEKSKIHDLTGNNLDEILKIPKNWLID